MISGIKVCIWDFDGTLYPLTPDITQAIEDEQYKTIMRYKGWDHDTAKKEFWSVYPKQTTSGNAAVGMICGIPTAQASVENEKYFDRLSFLTTDPKLTELFSRLKQYRHFILGNGVREKLTIAARGIGIPDGTFEEIVTSEITGVNKPQTAGYLYIMKKTGCAPEEHLMIGDREVVDLAPAKKVGMHTCLVTWGNAFPELDKPGTNVDIKVSAVYDIAGILKSSIG